MAFHKTGIVPIEKVKCTCGYDIKGHTGKCPNCGKTLIPTELQTNSEDITPKKKKQIKN